jgi:hypothetical protein
MLPDLTSSSAFQSPWVLRNKSCPTALFVEGSLSPSTSLHLKSCDYFPLGYLKNVVFQKHQYTIPELRTEIRPEIEAISAETLAKVLNSFFHNLHKFRDLRGHHMRHFLT